MLWTLVGCCYLLCNISFDRAMEENEMVSGDNHTRAVMLMMIRLSQENIHIKKISVERFLPNSNGCKLPVEV